MLCDDHRRRHQPNRGDRRRDHRCGRGVRAERLQQSEQQQRDHVVQHGGGDDQLANRRVERVRGAEHVERDADGGGRKRAPRGEAGERVEPTRWEPAVKGSVFACGAAALAWPCASEHISTRRRGSRGVSAAVHRTADHREDTGMLASHSHRARIWHLCGRARARCGQARRRCTRAGRCHTGRLRHRAGRRCASLAGRRRGPPRAPAPACADA